MPLQGGGFFQCELISGDKKEKAARQRSGFQAMRFLGIAQASGILNILSVDEYFFRGGCSVRAGDVNDIDLSAVNSKRDISVACLLSSDELLSFHNLDHYRY